MWGRQERSSTMRAPLDAALETEIQGLDLRISQVWQVLGAVGMAGGVVLGVLVSGPLGFWGGARKG